MNRGLLVAGLVLALGALHEATFAANQDTAVRDFREAIDLVHAFSGNGSEMQRAMEKARALFRSQPTSGYAQTIMAEALSSWEIDQAGEPAAVRDEVLRLADEASRLNPRLAEPYVAKARALLRASAYADAQRSIDAAIALDPLLSGTMFLQADLFRRNDKPAEADEWYRKFIVATPHSARKANGYYWLGYMYHHAALRRTVPEREAIVAKAREAYEQSLVVNPGGAWITVNFAIFLNDMTTDFDAAEHFAQKALGMMEFPMARYHLAAARYQRLYEKHRLLSVPQMRQGVAEVAKTTDVSLQQAMGFRSFSGKIRTNLTELQMLVFEPPVVAPGASSASAVTR
jgi:tetratricopeptide (TPR) repeat protein